MFEFGTMQSNSLGSLAACASVTSLSCGPDCVVAVGLCGRLRAWRKPKPTIRLSLQVSEQGITASISLDTAAANIPWELVLSESSAYEVANNRRSSHPYAQLSNITSSGRFVAATIEPTNVMRIYDTSKWICIQTLTPVEDEGDRDDWSQRGMSSVRSTISSLQLAHGHLACGNREGLVRLWKADRDSEFRRRFGNLRVDDGPVAAVVLTAEVLVAAYRNRNGYVDGRSYVGDQSVAAWSLSNGLLMWQVCPT